MTEPRCPVTTLARPLGALALVLALLAFGGGVWLGQSGTAVAPEPARLVEDLTGSTGATGAAVFVYSNEPTTVLKWTTTWTWVASPPAAGTPCATGNLAYGDETQKYIQRWGGAARCWF